MNSIKNRFAKHSNLIEKTIASYDEHADAFYKKHGDFEPIEALLEFQKVVPVGSTVLDAGCGLGRDTNYLREHGYPKTVGLDLSLGMLNAGMNLAQYKYPAVQGDFRELPFGTDSFDAIWAVASVIHIPKSYINNVLTEFKRVVKPNGHVYISIIKGKGEEAESGDEGIIRRGWRYFVFYEWDEIESILTIANFKKQLIWERPGKTPPPESHSKKRDWIHIISKV